MQFEGKTVLITGAAGGFGKCMAARFSSMGAKLVLSDLDGDGLALVAEGLKGDVTFLAGDVAQPEHHKDLVELALSTFGTLDVAVNNAGIVQPMLRIPDTDVDLARKVIDIDLMGVFYALQAQLPVMASQFENGGTQSAIVNIASAAGLVGSPFLGIYAAAKHGVVGLTRSAAAEYGRKGVRVNAVCPSFANTPMMTEQLENASGGREKTELALANANPMRRVGQADEVVEVILFAASPQNSFMTGETLSVDGGLTAV